MAYLENLDRNYFLGAMELDHQEVIVHLVLPHSAPAIPYLW